jgi:hypothetical protein
VLVVVVLKISQIVNVVIHLNFQSRDCVNEMNYRIQCACEIHNFNYSELCIAFRHFFRRVYQWREDGYMSV